MHHSLNLTCRGTDNDVRRRGRDLRNDGRVLGQEEEGATKTSRENVIKESQVERDEDRKRDDEYRVDNGLQTSRPCNMMQFTTSIF